MPADSRRLCVKLRLKLDKNVILERFLLRLTQFNLRILQSPLGINRIRDSYSGSNLVKNALMVSFAFYMLLST